jgi:hypothetical protein
VADELRNSTGVGHTLTSAVLPLLLDKGDLVPRIPRWP